MFSNMNKTVYVIVGHKIMIYEIKIFGVFESELEAKNFLINSVGLGLHHKISIIKSIMNPNTNPKQLNSRI